MAELKAAGPAPAGTATAPQTATLRRILTEWRQLGIIVALVVTVAVFTAFDRDFFSGYNFVNIVLQSSVTAILAIAETFVIITAGIDLSIGSVVGFASVIVALAWPITGGHEVAAASTSDEREAIFLESLHTRGLVLLVVAPLAMTGAAVVAHAFRFDAAVFVLGACLNGMTAAWFFAGIGDGIRLVINEGLVRLASYALAVAMALSGAGLWSYAGCVVAGGAVSVWLNVRQIVRRRAGRRIALAQCWQRVKLRGVGTVARVLQAMFAYGGATAFSVANAPALAVFSAADQLQKTGINGASMVPYVWVRWIGSDAAQVRRRSLLAWRTCVAMAVVAFCCWMLLSNLIVRAVFSNTVRLSLDERLAVGLGFCAWFLARSCEILRMVPAGESKYIFRATTASSVAGTLLLLPLARVGVAPVIFSGGLVSVGLIAFYLLRCGRAATPSPVPATMRFP